MAEKEQMLPKTFIWTASHYPTISILIMNTVLNIIKCSAMLVNFISVMEHVQHFKHSLQFVQRVNFIQAHLLLFPWSKCNMQCIFLNYFFLNFELTWGSPQNKNIKLEQVYLIEGCWFAAIWHCCLELNKNCRYT